MFTNALAIDEDGQPFADDNHVYYKLFDQPRRTRFEWLRHFFIKGNALCHPSILIRKSCYGLCGSYRYGFAQVADFDMWIRLCMKYEIAVMPEKLVRFRIRDNNSNTSGLSLESRIRTYIESYELLKNYRAIDTYKDFF